MSQLDDLLGGLLGGKSGGRAGGLDDLLGGLTGGGRAAGGGGGGAAMLAALAPLLGSLLSGGGLQELLSQFQAQGMGSKTSSWLSPGENEPLTGEEVRQVVGEDKVREAASRLGVSEDEAASDLAELIPKIVDNASPEGQLMDEQTLDDAFGRLAAAGRPGNASA
jgi:uncharacterized protein YidB (DUF937 family)